MEYEPKRGFAIEEMDIVDVEDATRMRLQSWLDTYVNEEEGVTREWIQARNSIQLSPERAALRRDKFIKGKMDGTYAAWVAKDDTGKIIGSTTPRISEDGIQHVGSLYVDKPWHGKGVANELMGKIINWFDSTKDIELGVVAYNHRAIAFYQKWGFEIVQGSETLFDDKIPELKMVRKGDS